MSTDAWAAEDKLITLPFFITGSNFLVIKYGAMVFTANLISRPDSIMG